ncbi:hypothetical protein HDU76_000731 [Blyttiomyces sp. JEL0837]|nr:hypothetical protein HDU76_000731 [Blyttiomyces sp. JEL0837]
MVLYKTVIHTLGKQNPCTISHSVSHKSINTYHHEQVAYPCCVSKQQVPSEVSVFYYENDGRPKELSGVILLSMMKFNVDNDAEKRASECLKEIKTELTTRPTFHSLEDNVLDPDSVIVRCITSSYAKIEMKGKNSVISFITKNSFAPMESVTIDTLEFALWGADVLDNNHLSTQFKNFTDPPAEANQKVESRDDFSEVEIPSSP